MTHTDPRRAQAARARRARLQAAADERHRLIALLVDGGQTTQTAITAVDRMIIALRDADAVRLENAAMTYGGDLGVKYAADGADWLRAHRHAAPVSEGVPGRAPRHNMRFLLAQHPGSMREPVLCRVTRTMAGTVHWREGISADGTGGTPQRAPASAFSDRVLYWIEEQL
ncbi:hypothetical protein [Streptomyces lavendulae]|uniref:hypothetical protein n=1 Tax=Streptomyces lavendulae TaxID=1914 RepID=UPI0024A53357|nr:hypothetical protein [Streptomyces lavendulae]GLX22591.1 hypothetical protein Slala01_62350 [Streptomyces lavendulae subsp. lavendulae]GLX30074.1 hypothetical protein Slala02_58940 [Streptomyces lavendulae subsp. lavendulae]